MSPHVMSYEEDVFYDLGGGVGKVALQMFLTTNIKKCCSIEYFTTRTEIADRVYQTINKEFATYSTDRQLQNIQGNFLEADLTDATIIFMDSLCFDNATIDPLDHKLNQLQLLRYVIGLKNMNLDKLPLAQTLTIEFSWSKGQPSSAVYVYAKPTLNII